MKKIHNPLPGIIFLFIAVVLLVPDISNVIASSRYDNKLTQNASIRNSTIMNIKMDGFWNMLFGKKSPTPTPSPRPRPTKTPYPTSIPTTISSFVSHTIIISVGQETSVGYTWNQKKENLQITKTISDAFQVIKKNDNRTLKIIGIKEGEGDVMLKDNSGKTIDTCHVLVISAPASTRSFTDHNLILVAGQKSVLTYRWDGAKEDLNFTKTISAEFQVTKKNNGHTLEIKGLVEGEFDIWMKDSEGKIIDLCHITVLPTPTKVPTPEISITAFFRTSHINIITGQKVTQYYYSDYDDKDIHLTVSKTGAIRVRKIKGEHKLNITGLKVGEADIKLLDKSGNVISTCHVMVNPAPARTATPIIRPTTTPFRITWHCIDNTTFDQNAYNDNICISSLQEVRYVSDSEAVRLDPSYTPSKAGDYYYNSK